MFWGGGQQERDKRIMRIRQQAYRVVEVRGSVQEERCVMYAWGDVSLNPEPRIKPQMLILKGKKASSCGTSK